MSEINARALMFSLAPEDASDSTTAAKIARYAERKHLAYNLTKEGALSLDGAGRKIHLKKGVVTLRNALDLHALPERVTREDASLQGQRCRASGPVGDNRVLTKQQQQTNVVTTPKTMLHVRKMALVDPRLLYNQALLRYNDMTKARAAKPIPVVVAEKKEASASAATVGEPTDVVGTLPKTLQTKGRQLLSRLSTVAWNERGELMHDGVAIPGSNAVDLVHDLLRKRKTSDPVGWQQFANQMRAANIPMELVGNVTRRRYIQEKRGKRTPQKRKSTPETTMSGWESL